MGHLINYFSFFGLSVTASIIEYFEPYSISNCSKLKFIFLLIIYHYLLYILIF
jgi:hypothetical protein